MGWALSLVLDARLSRRLVPPSAVPPHPLARPSPDLSLDGGCEARREILHARAASVLRVEPVQRFDANTVSRWLPLDEGGYHRRSGTQRDDGRAGRRSGQAIEERNEYSRPTGILIDEKREDATRTKAMHYIPKGAPVASPDRTNACLAPERRDQAIEAVVVHPPDHHAQCVSEMRHGRCKQLPVPDMARDGYDTATHCKPSLQVTDPLDRDQLTLPDPDTRPLGQLREGAAGVAERLPRQTRARACLDFRKRHGQMLQRPPPVASKHTVRPSSQCTTYLHRHVKGKQSQ